MKVLNCRNRGEDKIQLDRYWIIIQVCFVVALFACALAAANVAQVAAEAVADPVAAVYVSQEDDDGNNETTESVSDIIS